MDPMGPGTPVWNLGEEIVERLRAARKIMETLERDDEYNMWAQSLVDMGKDDE